MSGELINPKMTDTQAVDPEVIEAAEILCMLARDTRQHNEDPNMTEDEEDCIITHVRPVVHRPVVHRHHPYRRPEVRHDPATVARARRDAKAVGEWMSEWLPRAKRALGQKHEWNIFPLEDHEAQPDAPVPEVRRAIRDGVVVVEKVPLPRMQSSGVQGPRLLPAPIPTAVHSESQSLPINVFPYPPKQLALQALLAAPEREWMQVTELVDYLYRQYPQALESDGDLLKVLKRSVNQALRRSPGLVEKFESEKPRRVYYRLFPDIRDEATRWAWPDKRERSAMHNVPA